MTILLKKILKGRQKFSGFSPCDLDFFFLARDVVNLLTNVSIYINAPLSNTVYKNFISLKVVAKNLGC